MEEQKIKLLVGSLLHDCGKLMYRYNDGRNHSTSGYEMLKENDLISDKEILNCVRYHHAGMLKNASVDDDEMCYITYIADNIAAFVDRRENENGDGGFVRDIPSESIFNILNKNNDSKVYSPVVLDVKGEINYPTNKDIKYSEEFYGKIVDNIKDYLTGVEMTNAYINSLLEILEGNLTYVPSSTQTKELRDISLFDHVKLTAMFSVCIYDYLKENSITNYRERLFSNAKAFYDEKVFMLYSIDISGIQDFIYTISSKGALKGLRARSFYLEILMESIVDNLLDSLELSRINLLYTGGGHAYLMLPATKKAEIKIKDFENTVNEWFLENYNTALYIAGGFCKCSANELRNQPKGVYKEIFRSVSNQISVKKMSRYSPEQILKLNTQDMEEHSRECKICRCTDKLTEEGYCETCDNLLKLSNEILHSEFFSIVRNKPQKGKYILLPFDCYMVPDDKINLIKRRQTDEGKNDYIRTYGKNEMFIGFNLATKLWVGDYVAENSFKDLVENSEGIKRLGVLRADVDNLGQAFTAGFENSANDDKYETLSRTAVFSRKLSTFFKLHINKLLENGVYSLNDDKVGSRNAVIVYSGGDDVFVVGGWDDIIGFAIDLHDSFEEFTQGTLTLSAGIGIYDENYPIYDMARQTGELEDMSKSYVGKNAITLFDSTGTYNWEEFEENVLGEKFYLLQQFFEGNNERGKNMLYNLLELIRNRENENRLNIARFAYVLSRLEPTGEKVSKSELDAYRYFAKNMYAWIQNEKDSKELVTAIYLYTYITRERNDEDGEIRQANIR